MSNDIRRHREDRAFEALIVLQLRRARDITNLSDLPELTAPERAAMRKLPTDLVQQLWDKVDEIDDESLHDDASSQEVLKDELSGAGLNRAGVIDEETNLNMEAYQMHHDQNLSRRGMLTAPAAAAFGPLLVRHESDVPDSESRCGIEKGLCSSIDGGAARACSMTLTNVEAHYHKQTTEIYYFLDGDGVALLNGEEHPVRKGSFLHIPPGVVHSFTGSAKVLIVGVPAIGTDEDMFFPSAGDSKTTATA